MTHPIPFTFIGFMLNSLVDEGNSVTIREVKTRLENNTLFEWLTSKHEDFDMSLFSKQQLREVENYFNGLANTMDESRKMGVSNNGLCLLVGYCFQAAQSKQTVLHPPMKELYGA